MPQGGLASDEGLKKVDGINFFSLFYKYILLKFSRFLAKTVINLYEYGMFTAVKQYGMSLDSHTAVLFFLFFFSESLVYVQSFVLETLFFVVRRGIPEDEK